MGVKIALVTTPKGEVVEAKPAYEAYGTSPSRWVDRVLEYLSINGYSPDNIYFLHGPTKRIIRYGEMVEPHPVEGQNFTKKDGEAFAKQIAAWIGRTYPNVKLEVGLHVSGAISHPLGVLLDEMDIPYEVFAKGVALCLKAKVYEELIEQKRKILKWKERQRGARTIVGEIGAKTPETARTILNRYKKEAAIYEVKDIYRELEKNLKQYDDCYRQAVSAREEYEEELNKEECAEEIMEYLKHIHDVPDFFRNQAKYEIMKSGYGKLVGLYTTYLTKMGYAKEKENKLFAIQLKLSSVLLKRVM